MFYTRSAGVGKLTVGRRLEGLTGYRLLHDYLAVDLVKFPFEFGPPEFDPYWEKLRELEEQKAMSDMSAAWMGNSRA